MTALRAEGCGIAFGHTFGVKVQRVQRVRPAFGRLVQRVADCPSGVKVLRIDRPEGRRVLKFDGPSGRGLWIAALRQCL